LITVNEGVTAANKWDSISITPTTTTATALQLCMPVQADAKCSLQTSVWTLQTSVWTLYLPCAWTYM